MSTVYQCNIYVSQYGEELFDYSFVCIANGRAELVEKIRKVLRDRLGCTKVTMDDVIDSFEHFYIINTFSVYARITARAFVGVDEEQLEKSFKEISKMSDNHIDIDILKLRELMIGYQYDIKYLRNGISIEKSEILYNGHDNDVMIICREDSDYHKHGKNKFSIGDFVKVKYLENSPVFVVCNCPDPVCTSIDWENFYDIAQEDEHGISLSTVHENDIVHCTIRGEIL